MSGMHTYGQHGAVLKIEPARRRIEPAHLKFVEAHGHRMSWQAMAAACGVNQSDLKRACERSVSAAEPLPAAKPAAPRNLPGIDPFKVLRAIRDGAVSSADIADVCQCSPKHATALVGELKARGWLAGHGGAFAGWIVTEAGHQALAGRVGKGPPKIFRVLRMLAEGRSDLAQIEADLEIGPHVLNVYLSRLRHDGLLYGYARGGGVFQVTPRGFALLGIGEGGRE